MTRARRTPALLLAAGLSFATPAFAEGAKGFDEPAFTAAIAKAKANANDPAVDFTWLRRQNLLRLDYAIPDWDQAEGAFGAIDSDPQSALRLAQRQIDARHVPNAESDGVGVETAIRER